MTVLIFKIFTLVLNKNCVSHYFCVLKKMRENCDCMNPPFVTNEITMHERLDGFVYNTLLINNYGII